MKCNQCGFEFEEAGEFCPNCGSPVSTSGECGSTVADKVLGMLKDSLYLVLCILQSVACGIGILGGSFNVIGILLTIFMWLVYSSASKGTADVKCMRNISGTIYANYVLSYVAAGLVVLIGVLANWVLTAFSGLFENVLSSTGVLDQQTIDMILGIPGGLVMAVFIVAAVIVCLINYFGYRKLHRLAKSLYIATGSDDMTMVENVSGAKAWLWVYGICSALGAAGSLTGSFNAIGFISSGCAAACYIVAAILINKHLAVNNY